MNNLLKLSVVVLIIMVCLGIGFFIWNKNNETKNKNAELQNETVEYNRNLINRGICLNKADADYVANWNSDCYANGLLTNCSLPTVLTNQLNALKNQDKSRCLQLYPVK